MTNDSIDVIVRFRAIPGKLEVYKQAMDFILSTAEAKEPYVLEYDIYNNAEGVYTQYEPSATRTKPRFIAIWKAPWRVRSNGPTPPKLSR